MHKTDFFFSCCVSGAQLRKLTITALVKPMQANYIRLTPNCTVVNIRALVVNQKHIRNSKSEKKQYYTIISSGPQIRLAEQVWKWSDVFSVSKEGVWWKFVKDCWRNICRITHWFRSSVIGMKNGKLGMLLESTDYKSLWEEMWNCFCATHFVPFFAWSF